MRLAGLVLAIAVGSGCATIARGTRQEIAFSASPPGVEVYDELTDEHWTAPDALVLDRASPHLLVISREGYRAEMINVRSETSAGWMIGTMLLTLGTSTALDALLGGLYHLEPERVYVVLEREPALTGTK